MLAERAATLESQQHRPEPRKARQRLRCPVCGLLPWAANWNLAGSHKLQVVTQASRGGRRSRAARRAGAEGGRYGFARCTRRELTVTELRALLPVLDRARAAIEQEIASREGAEATHAHVRPAVYATLLPPVVTGHVTPTVTGWVKPRVHAVRE